MNPTVTYNTPGFYNIQLIVSSTDNCKDTTQGIISVTPYPVFDLGADTSTCEHQIDLNVGVSNATYIWSNGTTDTNATFSQSGVVWVQVDSGNCTIRDSILLTFNEHPDADIDIDGICINDSVIFYDASTIGQSNIIQWEWTIDSQTFNTQIIDTQFSQEGNVTVSLVVTNDLGCTDTIDKDFHIHSPDNTQMSTSGDVTIHVGDEAYIEAYGGQSHQWDPSHLTSNPSSDMTFVFPERTTTFKVTALDDNGCVIEDSLVVEVYEETIIYIPTAFTPNGDGDNDYFYISGKNICNIEYKIYNRWGQMVFETNELNSKWDGTLKDNTQNMEAFAISGKAGLCDGNSKTFNGKVHLLR
jgi:gliding motility-associated-like protein